MAQKFRYLEKTNNKMAIYEARIHKKMEAIFLFNLSS